MRISMKPVSLRGNYSLEEKKTFPWFEIYCAITAGFSFFCIGTMRSYTSPAIFSMEKDITFNHTLTQDEFRWFASAPSLASLGGAVISAPFLQFMGRKKSIIALTFPCLVGWLLIAFATNMTMAIVGRAFTGIASGLATSTAQLYVSECSRVKTRGILGFLPGVMLALGILAGLIIGTSWYWRCAALVMTVFPVVLLIMSCFIDESPTWLLLMDRDSDAYDNLQRMRGKGRDLKVRRELNEVKDIIDETKASYRKLGRLDVLSRQEIWWPTCLTISLMIFQQFSGANAVLYYLENILSDAEKVSKGGKLNISLETSSIIVGVVQVVSLFISLPLIDWIGRRALLLTSTILMALSHLALGSYFYLCEQHKTDPIMTPTTSWLPLSSLGALIASYSIGFACIPFIIASEVFPPHLRSYLCSLTSITNLLGTFLVVQYFPFLKDALYPGYVYYFFGIVCLISIIVTAYALPETKGKSLAKIQKLFRSNNSSAYDDMFPNSSFDSNKLDRVYT